MAAVGLLLSSVPVPADPVFLEYRCLLGSSDAGEGVYLGWEGQRVDHLLAAQPAAPGSDRLAPRRVRLPLYTNVPNRSSEEGVANPLHPSRARDSGPHFTMGVGVGVTIGSALLYVQLGT
jgi:hypothetical protein